MFTACVLLRILRECLLDQREVDIRLMNGTEKKPHWKYNLRGRVSISVVTIKTIWCEYFCGDD